MFKKVLAISAATLAFIGVSNATIASGKCETIALQENFDALQYLGTWYEQARDKGMYFEKYDCDQARYSLNADGSLAVLNTEYNEAKDVVEQAHATAKCNGAQCKVYFAPFVGGDYRVLSTDYTNYSLVYSCEDLLGVKDEMIWVLTREQELTDDIKAEINGVLKAKIPSYDVANNVRVTKHGGSCKYLEQQ